MNAEPCEYNLLLNESVALLGMGLAVGFLVGLTSMGGATLMTPVLILAFGMRVPMAIGTDLAYAAITRIAGALFCGKRPCASR